MTLERRLADLFAVDTEHLPLTGPGINPALRSVGEQRPPRRTHGRSLFAAIAATTAAAVVTLLVLTNRPHNSPASIAPSTVDTQSPTTSSIAPTAHPTAFAVGDEVMLGAKQELVQAGILVDAEANRFADDTHSALEHFFTSTTPLPDVVVIQMGTNGPAGKQQYQALLDIVGNRRVIMITVHGERNWMAANNTIIRGLPADHPNVTVVDWDAVAGDHPEWFAPDGIHLAGPVARNAYTNLVLAAIAKP